MAYAGSYPPNRIPSVDRSLYEFTMYKIDKTVGDGGLVEGEVNGEEVSIDVSFLAALLATEYDPKDAARYSLGATYKQVYRLGHLAGFDGAQLKAWVAFCEGLPLNSVLASRLFPLLESSEETKEAKRLIDGVFEKEQ